MTVNNVLWICVDDLTQWAWIEDACGITVHKPNMDTLRVNSIDFTAANCIQTICNPSRAAFCTGLTPAESMVNFNGQDIKDVLDLRLTVQNRVMRKGVYSWSSGKIFHSDSDATIARYTQHNDKFKHTDTPAAGGETYYDYAKCIGYPAGQDDQFKDYKVAQSFIDWIGSYSGGPFFAQLGFFHPHVNYYMPQSYFDLYDPLDITFPVEWLTDTANIPEYAQSFISDRHVLPEIDEAEWRAKIHGYCAALSHMDYQLGRVMAALDASAHASDTMVIFFSDHGYAQGDHDTARKHALWQQITSIPMFIRHPDHPPRTEASPVNTIDIPATTCAVFDTPCPGTYGRDLEPLMAGDPWIDRASLTMWQGAASIQSADGTTRYTAYPNGETERYDLTTDPECATNIAGVGDDSALLAELVEQCALAGYSFATQTYVGDAGAGAWIVPDDIAATIEGGAGSSQYYVTDAGKVIEAGGGGIDTLWFTDFVAGDEIQIPRNFERVEDGMKNHIDLPGGLDVTFLLNQQGVEFNMFSMYGTVIGGRGADVMDLNRGWTVRAGSGDDTIIGGYGELDILGGGGRDYIEGSTKADTIDGGAGADVIDAGDGGDTITIRGGDTVTGGDGNDAFTITRNSRVARVTDFTVGDTITFDGWTPTPVQSGSDVVAQVGRSCVVFENATLADVVAATV